MTASNFNLEGKVNYDQANWRRQVATAMTQLTAQVNQNAQNVNALQQGGFLTSAVAAKLYGPEAIRRQLQIDGSFPLILYGLPGSGYPPVIIGLWAALPPVASRNVGDLFWATDRTVLYLVESISGVKTWTYILGTLESTRYPDLRPTDLTTTSTGFKFYATDLGLSYEWSGTAWTIHTELGICLTDVHGNRYSSGVVDTNGTAVAWVSGDTFLTFWAGSRILINNVYYTVASVAGIHDLTLTATAGVQAGVVYRITAYPATSYHAGVEFYETDRQLKYIRIPTSGTVNINAGGVVNTNGTAVDWVSGDLFDVAWVGTFAINGVNYTISTVNSNISITLTATAGVQTGVIYSFALGNGTFVTQIGGSIGVFDPLWVGSTIVINSVSRTVSSVLDATHLYLTASIAHATAQTYSVADGEWLYQSGIMPGTIFTPDQKPADFTYNDIGALFNSTDYDRLYRWTGTAYTDAPGQESRGLYLKDIAPPTTGWHICDGTAGVRRSKPDGSTQTFTVPNLNGANASFLVGANAYSGPSPTPPVAPILTGSITDDAVTDITIDPNFTGVTTTETPGEGQAGTGFVADVSVGISDPGHDHAITDPGHHHGLSTVTVDDNGAPQAMAFIAFMRL